MLPTEQPEGEGGQGGRVQGNGQFLPQASLGRESEVVTATTRYEGSYCDIKALSDDA